jgi:riboflavin kinase/FMN adenylyltransferase
MATHQVEWQAMPPEVCRRGAVAIGNFDGVHRGHAMLVAELRRQADNLRCLAVPLTFDPHPLALLRPGPQPPPLSTLADRARWLHDLGTDHVLILHTTPDLLALRATEFFDEVLCRRLAVRALVEGGNFGFGRGREGDIHTLERLCQPAGVVLAIVPPVLLDGEEVSSSRIRTALLGGAVEEAARLLGRPHRLHGTVGTGQRRGMALGFPTANLEQLETLVPGDGVYAVRAHVRGAAYPGAASVGPNPTFGEDARKVEVHLLDFHGDLYGQPLAVDFLRRLRDIRTFAGVPELVEQLRRDVEQARQAALPSPDAPR